MRKSLKGLNFANEKNLRISEPKIKSVSQLPAQSFPSNQIYLDSPKLKSTAKEDNRGKLIEQNMKLKSQVLSLAQQMDQILSKDKQKKKYGLGLQDKYDKETEIKRLEAKKQEIHILQIKNQIFSIKKQIQYVYDDSSITEKENSVKALENQIKLLETERNSLLKVRKQQEKALGQLRNDDRYTDKIQKMKSQLSKIKDQCKVLSNKMLQNERLLIKNHQKVVTKNKRIKDIEEKIKQNKQKIKKGTNNVVTIEMISQIEAEIIRLESQFKQSDQMWTQKINNLDLELNHRRIEEQKKLLILKDKQKQVKLNDIRLKQFKKLIVQARSQRKLQPNQDQTKQYRNKRNIKFLQRPV